MPTAPAALALLALASACWQPAPQPAAQPPANSPPRVTFEELPPAARLGVRVESLRRRIGVIPTIVVVPDTASYVAAIAAWSVDPRPGDSTTLGARYPVLIDDGSWRAREDIARFARAFKPASVVRWKAPPGAELPTTPNEFKAAVERAAYRAWGAATLEETRARWAKLQFDPPGVVVAAPADPAWTAALALAAGRGQLFAWTLAMRDLSGEMSKEEARALNKSIAAACEAAAFRWNRLGDQIDGITLCMSTPATVRAIDGDARGSFAATDVIGRGAGLDGLDAEARWAWAGQVPGASPRAAYAAMCSLFLQPERAWLFDGYENREAFADYDASAAAIVLEKAGIATVLNDNGNQSDVNWRNRGAGMGLLVNNDDKREPAAGIDAGLIAVNSQGYPERFQLNPGECRAGDVPFLHVPAAVHFVHSFSAARPADRSTIAGRFIERGAFAYVGAVHEPFLQAFMRTPLVMQRMLANGPWGASVRLDDAPTWKVAVFGDPLWTLGPPAARIDTTLPLEGAADVTPALADLLKSKNYADALWTLAFTARDADAARIVRAIAKDDPEALTPDVALAAVMPVFRAQGREGAAGSGERTRLLTRLLRLLEPRFGDEPELRDIAWHATFASGRSLSEEQLRILGQCIRPEQSDRDAADLAAAALASLGRERATTLMDSVLPRLTDPAARQAVQRILTR